MLILDRIENDIAVIEADDKIIEVHISELAENVKEGDVLTESDGKYIVDSEATVERREKLASMYRNRLRKKRKE
jgi:hypothetical protein